VSETHGPILVIEDDRDLRDSLCGVLEIEGFPTAAASNGKEALSWLRTHPRPCAILLDLMMPVMNGLEFRSQQVVDARLAGIPVIVLSALDEGLQRSDLTGAQAYLKKPIEPDTLLDTIRRFC
jgi:CheY-like chemotaxis protein